VALLLGVSACGDDDGAADPAALDAGSDPAGSSSTTTAPDGSNGGDDVDTADATTSTTSTVLVAPEPAATDTTPATTLPAAVGIPAEGERTNEGGVPITLDETAALACANAEFARDSITFDNLDQAERDLSAAADRAEVSEQPAIADEADTIRAALDTADPLAVVEAFLDICVEHGHQI
jgi:hypothetical protein